METPNTPSTPEWSATLRRYLHSLQKSTRFLGILTWVAAGLVLLAGLFIMGLGGSLGKLAGSGVMGGISGVLMGLLYAGIALLYYYLGRYLYRASRKFQQALQSGQEQDLHACFEPLHLFFRIIAIVAIAFLGLYALIILFALIAGGIGAFMA
jgi:small-conductance mechanosensitive channel